MDCRALDRGLQRNPSYLACQIPPVYGIFIGDREAH